jgi:hypothetical protein
MRVGIHTDPANCTCISVLLGNLGHPVVSAGLLVLYLDRYYLLFNRNGKVSLHHIKRALNKKNIKHKVRNDPESLRILSLSESKVKIKSALSFLKRGKVQSFSTRNVLLELKTSIAAYK